MDSKHMQTGILIAFLSVLMIVSVVLIANWDKISGGKRTTTSVQSVVSVQEISDTEEKGPSLQIGNNLYAWKDDESFFDSAKTVEEVENRIITEKIPEKINEKESDR